MEFSTVEQISRPDAEGDVANLATLSRLYPRNDKWQHTLSQSVTCRGQGLHTGCQVGVTLRPAPPNFGIRFRRTDLNGFEIPAEVSQVAHVSYATTLMRLGVMVATVEHLLSALYGYGIDNAIVELDSLEVPIMDGSALPFARLIEEAGREMQAAPRVFLRVLSPVEVHDGERKILLEPSESFSIHSTIEFNHPVIGKQHYDFQLNHTKDYLNEIAPARTFGFEREIDSLRAAGLIRGGSLENAIVLSDDGILNAEGLRFADEFARHKILDIIGDLALIGYPLKARVSAERSGHALHSQLVSHLMRQPECWELQEEKISIPATV